tara:strand:- start:60 stop:287 length:228 start_codon:yes stop_codon:yes gene_type:complete
MGQSMCGGARVCEHVNVKKRLDLGVFDNSQHFCAMRKASPYYKKKIRRAERRVANAKLIYKGYKESKNRKRSNSE